MRVINSLVWLTAIFFIEIAVIPCKGSSTGLTYMYSSSEPDTLSSKSNWRPPFNGNGFLWRKKPEANSSYPSTSMINNNNSASTTTKENRLLLLKFDPQISEILSPDIFSQENPFYYLLNKMMIYSGVIAESLASILNFDLKTKKFPPEYIPYARALLTLLRKQGDLFKLQQSIREVKSSIDFDKPSTIFSNSPKLQMLFSKDIFSDTNPPACVLNKMLDLSEDEVIDVKVNLVNNLWNDEVPQQYIPYVQAMVSFMRNSDTMGSLRRARSELKRFSNVGVVPATQMSKEKVES